MPGVKPSLGGTVTIYIDGTQISAGDPQTPIIIQANRVKHGSSDGVLWTYSGNGLFLGLSTTQGATVPDSDLKVGGGKTYTSSSSAITTVYLYSVEFSGSLANTKWYFNRTIPIEQSSSRTSYNISFNSNNNSYAYFGYGYAGSDEPNGSLMFGLNAQMTTRVYEYIFDDGITNNWYNNAYRYIQITGGTDATNVSLINWLLANATQITIDDLSGTEWVFNDILDFSKIFAPNELETKDYEIDFECVETPNVLFSLSSEDDGDGIYYTLFYNSLGYVYDTLSGWQINQYKTISITDGTDATKKELIAFLLQNATQQVQPQPSDTNNIFIGNLPLSKMFVGNDEVSKVYFGTTLVYEKGSPTPSGYSGTVIPECIAGYDFFDSASIYLKFGSAPSSSNDWDYKVAGNSQYAVVLEYQNNGNSSGTFTNQTVAYAWWFITDASSSNAKIVYNSNNISVGKGYNHATQINLTVNGNISMYSCYVSGGGGGYY